MKRRHRIPPQAYFVTEPVTPEYQAEVDRTLTRAQQRERDAQRRLEVAEQKVLQAEAAQPLNKRALLAARELAEIRRQELLDVQRTMGRAPAAAANRGLGHAKRPIPGMSTL